jgi:hypothetical protein
LSGVAASLAVERMAFIIWTGVDPGLAWRIKAATPAASGHENDVPEADPYPAGFVALATRTEEPLAITSGLIRGGTLVVGPTELKLLRAPVDVTAPTARTLSPSAGAMSVL